MFELHGRREILTPVDQITKENVVRVLTEALAVHNYNAQEIDYLHRYVRGEQPILLREKTVRPEINNKVVENHAAEVANFISGYFLGEPLTYVRRGDVERTSKEVAQLNDYMFYEDKASHDKDIATWMAVCGVAYRMVLPDRDVSYEDDDSPFELDTPDPRHTFVVYNSGFGHHRMMGVRQVFRKRGENDVEIVNCGYTDTHYFEVKDSMLLKWEPHALGDIPIFEYRLNMYRMGSFEPAIKILDAINLVESDRVNGLESFVQSFLKFKNCEVDQEAIKKLSSLGAIMVKSVDGVDGDVEILSQELNQTQTQTFVDYLYDQVLTICGLPTTTKGGTSTSDTGAAVLLRDGWQQCEARARDTELLFKRSEKQFLRLVLRIVNGTRGSMNLKLSDIECKFTRRQHDNLLTKTQALLHMEEAGIAPEIAIAECGVFNDPMDVAARSKKYLEKWEPVEEEPDDMEPTVAKTDSEDKADSKEVTTDEETE